MLRLRFLLIHVFLLLAAVSMYGQSNTSPCSAACLDGSGTLVTKNPGPNPGTNQPCGGGGTTEDNPLWWSFTTNVYTTSVFFNVTATNCSGNRGVQVSIWEGDDCENITFIGGCVSGFGGVVTAEVIPCKTYYLQVDGNAGDTCNVIITYPPSQIFPQWNAPDVEGPDVVCVGSTSEYKVTPPTGCISPDVLWSATGGSPSSLITSYPSEHRYKVLFNTAGIYKVCAQRKSQCYPNGIETCKTINVTNSLQNQSDKLTLCTYVLPYPYCNIQAKANAALTAQGALTFQTVLKPCDTIISAAGSFNQLIEYTLAPSGCKGKINLKLDVIPSVKFDLGNLYLCKNESVTVCQKKYFATAKDSTYKITCKSNATNQCDTLYNFTLKASSLSSLKVSIPSKNKAALNQVLSYPITGISGNNLTSKWTIVPANAGKIVSATNDTLKINWLKKGTHLACVSINSKCDSLKQCFSINVGDPINDPSGTVVYKCSKTKPYTYTAIVSFSGGKAPYYVNNKLIKLSYYSIPNIPNGQSFTQTFKDSNGQSFTVTGLKVCDGTNLQAFDKPTEAESESMESAPNIEILDNKIVNLNEAWLIENVTIYNLQGQRLCTFDNTENLDLQACMAQYPASMYLIKTTLVSEKGEKRMVAKKLSVGN